MPSYLILYIWFQLNVCDTEVLQESTRWWKQISWSTAFLPDSFKDQPQVKFKVKVKGKSLVGETWTPTFLQQLNLSANNHCCKS